MHKLRIICLFLASLCSSLNISGAGQGADPSWVMPILGARAGARAAGMGGAFSAVADDISSLYWNPAGLSKLEFPEISFLYQKLIVDGAMEHVSGGLPVGPSGGMALGATYVSYGEFQRRNAFGAILPNSFNAYNIGLDLAYGHSLSDRISFGLTYRFWRQKIDYDSLDAHSLNLGSSLRLPHGIRLALTGSNLSTKVQGYNLPVDFRLGAAKELTITSDFQLLLATDVSASRNSDMSISGGLEGSLRQTMFLRLGYKGQFGDELGGLRGLSGGVGFSYSLVSLDYAIRSVGHLGEEHLVSLRINVANPSQKQKPLRRNGNRGFTPNKPSTNHFDRGQSAYKEGDIRTAISEFRSGLKIEPRSLKGWGLLGRAYLRNKKLDKAITSFEKHLLINPNDQKTKALLEKCKTVQRERKAKVLP